MSKKKGMADPVALKPFDADDKKLLRVIIETPKGSRNKFAFNEEERIFELKKVLPAGGCILSCRPIGVIEREQGTKKKRGRNDRIVAVEKDAHSFADIKTIGDLGKQFCSELEEFFVTIFASPANSTG